MPTIGNGNYHIKIEPSGNGQHRIEIFPKTESGSSRYSTRIDFINYAALKSFIDKCVSSLSMPQPILSDTYKVHPVLTDDGREWPRGANVRLEWIGEALHGYDTEGWGWVDPTNPAVILTTTSSPEHYSRGTTHLDKRYWEIVEYRKTK